MPTEISKHAKQIATAIKWDPAQALEYAYQILTECNLHAEAKALILAAAREQLKDEMQSQFIRKLIQKEQTK